MPVIRITDDDVNRSKPPESGWHLGRIEKFIEDESKDKKSKNWVFEIPIIEEGSNKGRYMFARFNSKAPGMLISSGFLPAALDRPLDGGMEFNPDELVGKELYGNVKDDTYEGKIQKRTEEFAPASKPPF